MASPARTLSSVSAFVLCAAAALGCGGGGDITSVSRSGFVARANETCSQAQAEFDHIQRTPASTPQAAERQVDALIDVSEQALDDLRSIEPPAELQAGYGRYLAARQRAIGFLEDGRDAAADRNAAAYARAKRRVAAQEATRLALARDVGLSDCSKPSVTLGRSG